MKARRLVVVSRQHPDLYVYLRDRFAAETDFSAILTDLNLKGMNGIELAARLTVSRPETKVLYMTGYSHEAVAGLGALRGSSLLQKPFTPNDLVNYGPVTPTVLLDVLKAPLTIKADKCEPWDTTFTVTGGTTVVVGRRFAKCQ